MTREENMGLDAEERALAERLRALKPPEPSAELDQRIRAHARAAVLRRPRWGWGMGVAATAVLSAVMLQQTLQNTQGPMLPEFAPAVTPLAPSSPMASEQAEAAKMVSGGVAGAQPASSDAAGQATASGESASAGPDAMSTQHDARSSSASAPREPVGSSGGSSTQRRSTEALSPRADSAAEKAGSESSRLREAEWAPDPLPPPGVPSAPAPQDATQASESFLQPAQAPNAKPMSAAPSAAAELKSEAARESVDWKASSGAPQPAPAAAPPLGSSAPGRNQPAAPPTRLEVTGSRMKRQADQPEFEFASFDEGVTEVRRLLAEGQDDRALQALRYLHDRYPSQALPDDLDALLRAAP